MLFDRVVPLEEVPEGYRAMDEREAIRSWSSDEGAVRDMGRFLSGLDLAICF